MYTRWRVGVIANSVESLRQPQGTYDNFYLYTYKNMLSRVAGDFVLDTIHFGNFGVVRLLWALHIFKDTVGNRISEKLYLYEHINFIQ